MSKRVSDSVESRRSPAKGQRIEPFVGVDNHPVNFEPLPQDGVLPYDDINAILVDFNVDEYVESENDLLITHIMKQIYEKLQKDKCPFKELLHGASGVGKTITLLFIGHMARKSGCIVFPIQASGFVNQEIPLSRIVDNFLSYWSRAVGDHLLGEIRCQKNKLFSNLLDLVNHGLSDETNSIPCFLNLVHELQHVEHVPVVFLIDQCNAFYTKHTVKIFSDDESKVVEPGSGHNPIASLFVQWNSFQLRRGCILYAFSSSFNLMPTAKDGNSNLFKTLQPMDDLEFKKLVELSININHLPKELLGPQTYKQLFDLCEGIPRELLSFTLAWKRPKEFNFDIVKLEYLEHRREFYQDRIKRLFNKEKMGEELVKASVSFASHVFVGKPMDNVPQIWKNAGLITCKNRKYQLLCPAAADALLTSMDLDVMRDAVSIFTSDPITRWRALELGVVYVFRQAIISSESVGLECTKLNGEISTNLYLKVKKIVHSESRPPVSSLPPGTMLVCPIRTPVIDFFIHDIDGQKVAIQVSESSYMDHKSKYPDFENIKEDYQNAVINGNLSEIQYVYLTTSRHKLKKTGKHFTEHVLLVSNINNGATRFFKNLIGSS